MGIGAPTVVCIDTALNFVGNVFEKREKTAQLFYCLQFFIQQEIQIEQNRSALHRCIFLFYKNRLEKNWRLFLVRRRLLMSVNLQIGISCFLRFHGNEVNDHLISQMLSDDSFGLMKGMRSNLSDGQT